MIRKYLVILFISSMIAVVLLEIFYPSSAFSIATSQFSDLVLPEALILGVLASPLQIRGVFSLALPLPNPIAPLILVIPETYFMLAWFSVGFITGVLSRRAQRGVVLSALVPLILLISYMTLLNAFSPVFWTSQNFVAQIQYGFEQGGFTLWAVLFSAVGGMIGGRATRPPKPKAIQVNMQELERITNQCRNCRNTTFSSAAYCAFCGAPLAEESTTPPQLPLQD